MSLAGALALALSPDTVGVAVFDCYTGSPPVEVLIDGRVLLLTPPQRRDDSVGLCGSENLPRESVVHVVIRSKRQERSFDLRIGPDTKVIAISAQGMTAEAMDKPLLLD